MTKRLPHYGTTSAAPPAEAVQTQNTNTDTIHTSPTPNLSPALVKGEPSKKRKHKLKDRSRQQSRQALDKAASEVKDKLKQGLTEWWKEQEQEQKAPAEALAKQRKKTLTTDTQNEDADRFIERMLIVLLGICLYKLVGFVYN